MPRSMNSLRIHCDRSSYNSLSQIVEHTPLDPEISVRPCAQPDTRLRSSMKIGSARYREVELLRDSAITLNVGGAMIGVIHLDTTQTGLAQIADECFFLLLLA